MVANGSQKRSQTGAVDPRDHDKNIATLVRKIDNAWEVPVGLGAADSAQDFELLAPHL
jgi:hypothetical protein